MAASRLSGRLQLYVRHQWCTVHAALGDDCVSLSLDEQTSDPSASGSAGRSGRPVSEADAGDSLTRARHTQPPENIAGMYGWCTDTLDLGQFGPKTFRHQTVAEVSRQAGTSAKVSVRHFGTGAKLSQLLASTLLCYNRRMAIQKKG